MANKKPKKIENEGNGQQTIQELLQVIAQNQQELSDRLSDLEETKDKKDDDNTKIQLAHMFVKPPDEWLVDLSKISPLAARPYAEAMALDAMTTPKVRSGEISLNKLLWLEYLHALRGVRGFILHMVADTMREQVSSEAAKGEENMPDFEAGKE